MIKFVVWGMGVRGKYLIEILGSYRVKAIIDSDECYRGAEYQGIPIINFEVYLIQYRNYPVIITPRDYMDEIKQQLEQEGIYHYFCYSEDMFYALDGFLMQAPIEQLIKDYKRVEQIAVYGLNLFGVLLYEFLYEKGFQCKIIAQRGLNKELEKFASEKLHLDFINWETTQGNIDRILLAQKITDDDLFVKKNIGKLEPYFELGSMRDLYYYPELEQFKDVHKNKRCFIVATGPSLKFEDLDMLYKEKEICISVNGIFKAFDKTLWRPDYYIIDDRVGVLQWRKEIKEIDVKEKFVSDTAWIFKEEEIDSNIHKWHFDTRLKSEQLPDFSDDFARGTFCGKTITYDGALQLAVYMGFSEIYLLGVDCSIYPSLEKQHFIPNYCEKQPVNLNVEYNMRAYKSARLYAENHGIKIYNATRGGELEVFERVNFDDIFGG